MSVAREDFVPPTPFMPPTLSRRSLSPDVKPLDGKRCLWPSALPGVGQVCCYVAGRSSGRPVLLVHDLLRTSSATDLRPIFDTTRWRRPTFALDLPGFGASPRPTVAASSELLAGVLQEGLRRIHLHHGAPDVVVLGRSFGLVARVAEREPSLVNSLVTIEPSFSSGDDGRVANVVERLAAALGESMGRAFFARAGAPPTPDKLFPGLTTPVLVVHDAHGARAVLLEAFLRGRVNRFASRVALTQGMPQFERRGETISALERFWQFTSSEACQASR